MVTLTITPDRGFFTLGEAVVVTAKITAADGTAADPTSVRIRSHHAEGGVAELDTTRVVTGTWTASLLLTAAGLWRLRADCLGANAGVAETRLDVDRSVFPPLEAP